MNEKKFEFCCWCETHEHPPFEKLTSMGGEIYEKAKKCHWRKLDAINEGYRYTAALEKNKKDVEAVLVFFLICSVVLFLGVAASFLT